MIEKIVKIAKNEIETLREYKRALHITTTILIPSLIVLLSIFYKEILLVNRYLFWFPFFILVGLQGLIVWKIVYAPQSVQEAYFVAREIDNRNKELVRENSRLIEQIGHLSISQAANLAWTIMERKYIEGKIENTDDLEEMIGEVLSVFITGREELFGFRSGELWNFTVYLYNENTRKLVPVWRERHHNHPSKELGREWGAGQGHIGKAFADRATKITGDATDPDVAALMQPPDELVHDYDLEAYKSFASLPIGPMNAGDEPLGVLVATSNQVNRFNKGNCMILRQAATIFGNVIHMTGVNIATLPKQNQNS